MNRDKYLLWIAVLLLFVGGVISSGVIGVNWNTIGQKFSAIKLPLQKSSEKQPGVSQINGNVRVLNEESVIIDVVDKASPSVVTIGMKQSRSAADIFQLNPFSPFGGGIQRQPGTTTQPQEQDIGTGFILEADGLIVTNKHVVEDTTATYTVITKDDKSYSADKIYRDPTNDLAIIKINATGLTPVELGNSDKIKVGQLAIAIGTALGEFRDTVTTGVISGVGRGITAGSPLEGSVERLDNVIQTDAAINPGNSGGPLLNSSGQVVGINTAVSSQGQNVGFAIPINVVKEALNNFNQTGQFNRPFLGIRYRTVSKDVAILNEVPEGAYILEVVSGSPADKAGVKIDDIITALDGTKLTGTNAELATVLAKKKVGDQVSLSVWRDGKTMTINATLGNQGE